MSTREEDLIEADRRGLLKGEMKADFDEAVRRGLITLPPGEVPRGTIAPQQEPTPTPAPQQQPIAPDPTAINIPTPFGGTEAIREFGEALPTVLSGLVAEPVAGLAGLAMAALPGEEGAGARTVEKVREALTIEPSTERGQRGLETIGALVEKGVDIANIPLSGLGAITELVAEQGLDQAVETIKSVQEEGVGKTIGDRTFEETGSAAAATIAETTPTAVLAALGVRTTPKGAASISAQRAKEIESVLEASRRTGVDVLTTDIFQPKSIFSRLSQQFSERIPILGTGGKRAAQREQRIEALKELEDSVPRNVSEDIFDSLVVSRDKFKKAAGKRLETVIEDMDTFGEISVKNTITNIDKAIKSLTKRGRVPNPALVDELTNLKQTALEASDNFRTLRDFRTDAMGISDKVDVRGLSQLRSTDKVLMDNVIRATTKDLDDFVLANSSNKNLGRYKQADKIYRREAIKLTKSKLKQILDRGEVTPERVGNLLFSSTPSEVKLLFDNLDDVGRKNSRYALYRKALDKAKNGDFSPERFVREVNGLQEGFDVFFRGDAKAELEGFKRLMQSTQRAAQSGVVTPTGQTMQLPVAMTLAAAAGAGNIPAILALFGSATVALGSRIYETSGVRNMLIRLGKAKKRGTLEVDLLSTIPVLLNEANRTLQQEEQNQKSQIRSGGR